MIIPKLCADNPPGTKVVVKVKTQSAYLYILITTEPVPPQTKVVVKVKTQSVYSYTLITTAQPDPVPSHRAVLGLHFLEERHAVATRVALQFALRVEGGQAHGAADAVVAGHLHGAAGHRDARLHF